MVRALILLLSLSLVLAPVAAQDKGEFYEKNFAENPGGIIKDQDGFGTVTDPTPEPTSTATVGGTEAVEPELKGEPVRAKAIGAVLNGLDMSVIRAQLGSLARLITKTKGYIEPLYVLGRPEEVLTLLDTMVEEATDEKGALMECMLRVKFVSSLPDTTLVTKAPSWLVTTDRGMYVLEGIGSPERFFTGDGRFIVPEGLAHVVVGSSSQKK